MKNMACLSWLLSKILLVGLTFLNGKDKLFVTPCSKEKRSWVHVKQISIVAWDLPIINILLILVIPYILWSELNNKFPDMKLTSYSMSIFSWMWLKRSAASCNIKRLRKFPFYVKVRQCIFSLNLRPFWFLSSAERDALQKDIEQLCMQQAGPAYLVVATRMHFQRFAVQNVV